MAINNNIPNLFQPRVPGFNNTSSLFNIDQAQVQQAINQKKIDDGLAEQEQRRRLDEQKKLQNLADTFRMINANKSGNVGAGNVIANRIAQRKLLTEQKQKEAEEKAKIEAFLATPQGAPYRTMYTLAGPKGVISAFASNRGRASNERFGVYNKDTKQLMGSVLKSDSVKISELENTPGVVVGQLRSPTVPTGKDGKMDLYSVTDGNGKRIKTISNPTQEDIAELNKDNLFVNKLPTPTDRGKGFDSGKPIEYKGWNDDNGLKTRYFATNTLINTGERLLQQLSEKPNSVLTAADLAQYFERAKAEVGALGGRPENYTSHLKDSQQSKIKELAQDAAVSESMLLDFTFQIAQARGQTGRGLSDKDFVIFQKIISAGLTADQKAAALTSFIEGIASEVNEDLTSNYNFYSKRLERNADDKEAMTFVTGIDDLRSMPFRTIANPFAQPTNGTVDPLGIR